MGSSGANMNIFILDECPAKASEYLCDKHVVKMILESTQILSTVAQLRGHSGPYKKTHQHHPCVKWVESDPANWAWLTRHAGFMCLEYEQRYQKIHKCAALLERLDEQSDEIWQMTRFENHSDYYAEHTPFVQCMPDSYKRNSAVEAYRSYYIGEKAGFAKWRYPSTIPEWFK